MKKVWVCLFLLAGLSSCGVGGNWGVEVTETDVKWESAFVETNGIRIHYWRTGGEEKPVMIMSHGITDYGLNWTSLAEKFEQDYDIILYDARGHGYSDKPEGPYDLDAHVKDLAGLINALNLEKPVLVGHSMGGAIVASFAATFPDVPRALVLEDPADLLLTLRPMVPGMAEQWKKMIEGDQELGKEGLIEIARTERHPGWAEIEYERWARSKLLVSKNVVDLLDGPAFGDARETYRRITVPVLILRADSDEAMRQKAEEIAEALPAGTLVHMKGAGHVIRMDKPKEIEEQIRTFLGQLN